MIPNRNRSKSPVSATTSQNTSNASTSATSNQPNLFKKKAAPKSDVYIEEDNAVWVTSHSKLMGSVKLIYYFVSTNHYPELTALLALKFYIIVQK